MANLGLRLFWIFLLLFALANIGYAIADENYVDNITSSWALDGAGYLSIMSNSTTGTWRVLEPPHYITDGNLSTSGRGDVHGTMYLNYTLAPTGTYAIAHYKVPSGSYEIDIPAACFDTTIQIKIYSHSAVATNDGHIYCWNTTAWEEFSGQIGAVIYEFDLVADSVNAEDTYGDNHGTLYGKTFYHGTNNGATSVDQTGAMDKFGKAYEFDGVDDWISKSSFDFMSVNGNYTMSFWVKSALNDDDDYLLTNTIDDNQKVGFMIRANKIFLAYRVGGVQGRTSSITSINPGTWYHVTGVMNNGVRTLYINGVSENAGAGSSTFSASAVPGFAIGSVTSGTRFANGTIDEVKIWNRALTADQIAIEKDASSPVHNDGLVAYYSFNDDVGNTVLDTTHLTAFDKYNTGDYTSVMPEATYFDGDDYISLGSINTYVENTFCANVNAKNSAKNMSIYADWTGANGDRFTFWLDTAGGNHRMGFSNGLSSVYSTGLINPNENTHVCVIINGTNALFYKNGQFDVSRIYNYDLSGYLNSDVQIGSDSTGGSYFNGSIADVRIFDRAITADEVYALYVGTDALTTIEVSPYIYNKPNAKVLIDGEYYTNYIDIDSQYTDIQTKAGNYSISLMDGSEVLATYEVTLNPVSNSVNLTDSDLNYVRFLNEGSPLATKNVRVAYPSGDLINLITDSSGYVNFTSYYDDEVQYGNYSITYLNDPGYITPITFTYDAETFPFNNTYNLSRTTVNINIYDRLTGNAFTENASIIFQGVNNVSTSTGNYTFDAVSIVSGNYTILVKSDGYFTEQKLFTFDNQVAVNLSYYLMKNNASTAVTVTIQVLDTTQTKIENAEVNMLEYDLTTLSYISVSQGYTNSEGKVVFLAELNDKTYKFTARKVLNGFLRSGDSGDGGLIFRDEIVAGSPITFEQQTVNILLTGFEVFEFNPSLYLNYDITENFNDTTNISTISVDFRTTDGSDATVCIEFYSVSGSTKTSELQICDTGNAGTITPDIPFVLNRTKSYQLEVYTLVDTTMMPLQTFRYQSSTSFQEVLRIYAILKPAVLFFWIAIISVAMYSGNLVLGGVLGIILSIIEFILFPNVLTASGGILKIIVCIQVIYFGRKKEDYA